MWVNGKVERWWTSRQIMDEDKDQLSQLEGIRSLWWRAKWYWPSCAKNASLQWIGALEILKLSFGGIQMIEISKMKKDKSSKGTRIHHRSKWRVEVYLILIKTPGTIFVQRRDRISSPPASGFWCSSDALYTHKPVIFPYKYLPISLNNDWITDHQITFNMQSTVVSQRTTYFHIMSVWIVRSYVVSSRTWRPTRRYHHHQHHAPPSPSASLLSCKP